MTRYFREPFSGFSHLLGAVLAVVGLVILFDLTGADAAQRSAMIVYGASLVLLYSASAALHLIHAPDHVRLWLSRFDHAAIYMLIAGTYTPFCYSLLSGGWRWGLLGTVWALAAVGIFFKLVFHRRGSRLGTLMYVAMGWMGVIAYPQIVAGLSTWGIMLLVSGGVLYTIGAFFYSLDDPAHRPRYFNYHDLWHVYVLSASVMHFLAVMLLVT